MTAQLSEDLLIVEDNPHDLELTLRALKRSGVTTPIHVARDGAEALDYLSTQTPRLILLDLKLPKIDGMEVLQRLKSDSKTRTIPVVMLTSSRQERDILTSYRMGVNSYVVKPVNYAKFAEAIAHLGRYWLSINDPGQ